MNNLKYCNPACDPGLGGYPDSDCFKMCGRHKELVNLSASMTPSQQAKHHGCKSLQHVANVTKQSVQTLINWHRDKPELFKVVCLGVASLNQQGLR